MGNMETWALRSSLDENNFQNLKSIENLQNCIIKGFADFLDVALIFN